MAGRLDIPAVFAAVSMKEDELDLWALSARAGHLRLLLDPGGNVRPIPVVLDAREGEGQDLDAAAVPGFLLDLARLGLAALRAAYATPETPVIVPIASEISRLRVAGLAMPRDPGVFPEGA